MCRSAFACLPRRFAIFTLVSSITTVRKRGAINESTLEYKTDKPLENDALCGLRL